jgi:hypothetical protein
VRVSPPATAAFTPSDPVHRIPAAWLKQGGIPAGDTSAYDRAAFLEKLATKFIPIDLDFPGLRIVNFDPAIFTIEGLMTQEECEQWQAAALDSGEMCAQSGVVLLPCVAPREVVGVPGCSWRSGVGAAHSSAATHAPC